MVKDLKQDQLKAPLITSITTACGIRRVGKIEGSEIKQMADMLSKTIKESFTTYTIPEIQKAIESGAIGDLEEEGDPYTVSIELCYKWITRYRFRYTREAKHKQKLFEEKQEKEAQETNKEQERSKFEATILKIYESFPKGFKTKNKGSLAAVYQYLDRIGLIKMPNSRKREILDRVREIRKRVFDGRLQTISTEELARYRALYEVFSEWKEFYYDLENEFKIINENKPQ